MADRTKQARRIGNYIRRIAAGDPVAEQVAATFEDLVRIDDSLVSDERSAEELPDLLLEVCRRYNFTKPFETDGKKRYFRPSMIITGFGFDEAYASDCPSWEDSYDPVTEQAYRRGYDQGFAEAKRLSARTDELEKRGKAIRAWRLSVFHDAPMRPGMKETWRLPFRSRSSLPPSVRYMILSRDNHTCQSCGARAPEVCLHVDHIIPVAHGGGNNVSNLQTLCDECNLGKGTRTKPLPS